MPLNKLENFIKNYEGRILYVNSNDLDATDSITNQGNSLTKPFKTIQRALIEAARFSFIVGNNNDNNARTTILVFPGDHIIDNRPGFGIKKIGTALAEAVAPNGNTTSPASDIFSLNLESNFDLSQEDNILYKFNSVEGGVIIPRGTSIVGLDLRKTRIRPKYVPNPTDPEVPSTSVFRVTGLCYFWQFSFFDADESGLVYTNDKVFSSGSGNLSTPTFSHHKLTCFEYADGVNVPSGYDTTDLDMYYAKLSNAFNEGSGRQIPAAQKFPLAPDAFAKERPEWEIVGAFAADPITISDIVSGDGATPEPTVTVTTVEDHELNVGTPIKIRGIDVDDYNISTTVASVNGPKEFTYLLPFVRNNLPADPSGSGTVTIETDTVKGASPYVFNCSLRSVWGMNGLTADGAKADGFRSMVLAQFTAVSLQKDDRAFVKYNPITRTYDGISVTKVTGSALSSGSASTTGPANVKSVASTEAVAGWFIGQDLGTPASYNPANAKKLFRLIGRGHGEWLHKNCKVSIEDIRQSNTNVDPYGTFSVVIRSILDTDPNPVVLERFDNCNLNPASPNYVAKLIGDKFTSWDSTNRELKTYGDYDNQSKYVRIEMNDDVDAGATEAALLPFGYYGPPKIKDVVALEATGSSQVESTGKITNRYLVLGTGLPGYTDTTGEVGLGRTLSSSFANCTASFSFPSVRLRANSTNGGTGLASRAYFGIDTNRETATASPQAGIWDSHRLWNTSMVGTNGAAADAASDAGMDSFSYIFTMDNVVEGSAVGIYDYTSGSRTAGTSYTAVNGTNALLDLDINKFTAPFWGGFAGFDITRPDTLRNGEMTNTSTANNSYVFHTYRRAIDTVSDPDYINMNLLAIPGLTQNTLTRRMIEACEERADAMAIIDLPDVYRPSHERYYADKTERIGTTPTAAANALKSRRIDSSYGATFYPWVRTIDANTSQQVWVPPTVAMMGVLASSEAASAIWFAPAGFNRGGLSNGAAGIPIDGVTERVSSRDRDRLYESRINPIASFPSEGIVVFGQKTLQERPSALDRINVRRLVIYLKKQISIISSNLLFEQNVQATWNRFKAQVTPLLANTRTGGGITDFRLYLDENTTTPDLIDQNIMYAKIMVKPARAIEYIAIDFVIASTGASFDD